LNAADRGAQAAATVPPKAVRNAPERSQDNAAVVRAKQPYKRRKTVFASTRLNKIFILFNHICFFKVSSLPAVSVETS